ncbi:hypothetical protein AGMMS49965_01840 [Bacteroidia bacterium]|nr:hypothetical protein AGMMS4957_04820 [Bacteroidia bacterium]GHT38446.1 hypothetical protein AGMMS49965_01840 [Bacteroidia bacterium]
MEAVISQKKALKYQLQDIVLDVTWSKIASRYFGKSSSWMYHKLNGVDGNGKPTEFTDEERVQFKNSLFDFSDRIRNAAYQI